MGLPVVKSVLVVNQVPAKRRASMQISLRSFFETLIWDSKTSDLTKDLWPNSKFTVKNLKNASVTRAKSIIFMLNQKKLLVANANGNILRILKISIFFAKKGVFAIFGYPS